MHACAWTFCVEYVDVMELDAMLTGCVDIASLEYVDVRCLNTNAYIKTIGCPYHFGSIPYLKNKVRHSYPKNMVWTVRNIKSGYVIRTLKTKYGWSVP